MNYWTSKHKKLKKNDFKITFMLGSDYFSIDIDKLTTDDGNIYIPVAGLEYISPKSIDDVIDFLSSLEENIKHHIDFLIENKDNLEKTYKFSKKIKKSNIIDLMNLLMKGEVEDVEEIEKK